MTRLFVYGSLMRGLCNHRLLADASFVVGTRTRLGYVLYDLGRFPAMVAASRGGAVAGEVYVVDAATLARIDRLESNGRWYQRTAVPLLDGTTADAYLLRHDQVMEYQVIAHGDWRRHHEEKTR